MHGHSSDTIIALSSGSLPSGVAVIRLSGPLSRQFLLEHTGGVPSPRRLTLAEIRDGDLVLDRGLVAFFPAPNSFTGEDCAELHMHGSKAAVRAILRLATGKAGIRLAEAGEFTRRAFENGKLDLTEAEGLGDLLAAETESQRALAVARAAGGLSQQIDAWRETLLDLRAEIEARLDFSDEGDVGAELPEGFFTMLGALRRDLRQALSGVESGRIIREGFRIALAGPPNAGKSSLLNALAKSDLAIVSPEAGTTRDVREVALEIGGFLVILLDMAGLRDTDSLAEAEGVRRAKAEIERADLVLWLVAPDVAAIAPPDTGPVWRIGTKADLGRVAGVEFSISAETGDGLDQLMTRIAAHIEAHAPSEGPALFSRERDRAALSQALSVLEQAPLSGAGELLAEDLRRASTALDRLVGRIDAEQVLGRLFEGFCIGK